MSIFTKKHSIGKTIADLRKQKGWTQIELAEKLQVSDKAVSKWEKDNGAPSIEFFPALAELFGVSIDYLMTGKATEKEVIAISKTELCAKQDNPKLVKEINPIHPDENGKTLIDYIIQYESVNVFIELCTINKNNLAHFSLLDAIRMCLISNRVDLLANQTISIDSKRSRHIKYTFKTEYDLLMLAPVQVASHMQEGQKNGCVLTDDFYNFLLNDKRINSKTQSFIYGNQYNRNCVWYHVFPYLIDNCYRNNNFDQLEKLLDLSIASNERGYRELEVRKNNTYNRSSNYFFVSFNGNYSGHGFVRILDETIQLALKNGDKYLEKFCRLNTELVEMLKKYGLDYHFKAYIPSGYELKMSKLKNDKNVGKEEYLIESVIHDDIVCIDELLKLQNSKLIKKILKEHPIHPIEKICQWYLKKEWRMLFEYAIDCKIPCLPEYVTDANEKQIEQQIIGIFRNRQNYWTVINQKYFNDKFLKSYSSILSIKDIVLYFERVKEMVLNNIQNKFDMDKITNDLTKEYFEKELLKGNIEIVVIKLCVRLEAALRCRGYEGAFEEMLSKYCAQFNTFDDEDNNYDPHTPRLLHKLRMQRNSIVHSKKTAEPMSVNDIKECIDYICKMN